jgi:hypothetical protein
MHQLLTSLYCAKQSLPDIIKAQDRPTVRAKLSTVQHLIEGHWWMCYILCNDKNGGPHPHQEFRKTVETIKEYSERNQCSLEDAWTILDPNPNKAVPCPVPSTSGPSSPPSRPSP